MNKVILSGNVVRDVEMRYTNTNNTTVVSFCLAVSKRGKDAGADFINCVCYGSTAEFINKHCGTKGTKMTVIGRINTRNYDDKEGKRIFVTEVIVEEVEPVWNKKEENVQEYTPVTDELPF